MSNANHAEIASLLPVIRASVGRVLGHFHADADDIANDVIVTLLSGAMGHLTDAGERKAYAIGAGKNAAINFTRRKCNKKHDSASGTDAQDESTMVLVGNGFAVAERAIERSALLNAIEACLKPDAQEFILACLNGMPARDAGKAMGWSQPTATRQYAAIVAELRAFMTEGL